jgi:hypothetical protein
MNKLLPTLFAIFLVACAGKPGKNIEAKNDTTQHVETHLLSARSTRPFFLSILQGSNWDVKIDTITANEFDEAKKIPYQERRINEDSLMRAFAKTYHKTIILSDSCVTLKTSERDVEFCNRRPANDREWTGFEAVDFKNGYLIVMEWEFETLGYFGFNPKTLQYFYTRNQPIFITDELIYSAGSSYTVGEFDITDMKENKYFAFDSSNLTGSYWENNSILLEFQLDDNSKKYLRISYAN